MTEHWSTSCCRRGDWRRAKALTVLVEAGVVVEFSGRGRRWRAPETISALDEFACRTGCRST